MHIAYYTNTYKPMISGVVRSVSSFRQALSELGHNIFVFAQDAGDYQDQEPFIFRYPTINISWPVDFPASIPISSFIDQLLPRLKLDVIHAHHPILLGQTAAHKAEELQLPLVFTFHTQYAEYSQYIPFPQDSVQDFIKEIIELWLGDFMGKCQHIIVPTESMRRQLDEKFGIAESISVVPTGIDLKPYAGVNRDGLRQELGWGSTPVLITVGRLAPEKNWDTFILAAAQVIKEAPVLKVVVVGEGPARKRLQGLAYDLGISKQIHFTGPVTPDEIPGYLVAADIFAFPSTVETQGLVTMEALAAGLPVVAVNAAGTRDVIRPGIDGLLTENDPHAMAAQILAVLNNDAMRNALQTAARLRAEDYAIHTLAASLVDIYQLAIDTKAAGRYIQLNKGKRLFAFTDSPK